MYRKSFNNLELGRRGLQAEVVPWNTIKTIKFHGYDLPSLKEKKISSYFMPWN